MRVVIWGINYAPEPTGIAPYSTDLARHLFARGADVEVVTGFAYYPAWRKEAADRGRWFRTDEIDHVPVHRCGLYVPGRLNTLKRMLHEISFTLTSLWRVLTLPRADVYVVISPPLALGPAAWLATRLKRSPFLFHVQDLQPDSAAGLGMVRGGLFLRALYGVENFSYARAAGVSGISASMVDAMAAKGVPREKLHLLPNWLRRGGGTESGASDAAKFRARHGIPADALLAVYSGNLGRKQNLPILLAAAEQLASGPPGPRPIVIVIAGEGAMRDELAGRLAARPLAHVRLLPLQEAADYAAMLRAADVALITQAAGTGHVCFPSKLLSVLAAGRPVITVADESSDLARAVNDGGFGRNVASDDASALARALRAAADGPSLVAAWADRTSWVDRFRPEPMLQKFELVLRARLAPARSPRPSLAPAGPGL